MNACLYIGFQNDQWCRKFLPELAPRDMPVGGKRWSHHAVDLCSQLGVSKVFIADSFPADGDEPSQRPDGSYWSLSLSYLHATPCATPMQLLRQHAEIPQDEDLLLFWGPVLPDIAVACDLLASLRPAKPAAETLPCGIWLLRGGALHECAVPLHRLDSLKHYFDLNFRFLEKPGPYTLPGYSADPGIHISQNVVILPNCHIAQPAVIHGNSHLGRSVVLKDGVIIGKNVLVDNYTVLKHSIVMDSTYVGTNLFFQNKVICGNRVIDVPSESFVDLDLGFLTHRLGHGKRDWLWVAEFLIALLLAVVGAPFFLVAFPFTHWLRRLAFFKFFLRIYPRCFPVLVGMAHLVRNGPGNIHYVFRLSDMFILPRSEQRKALDDTYFQHHRTLRLMLAVVFGSLFKRMVMLTGPEGRGSARGRRSP